MTVHGRVDAFVPKHICLHSSMSAFGGVKKGVSRLFGGGPEIMD